MNTYFFTLGICLSMLSWIILMRQLIKYKSENIIVGILIYIGYGLFISGFILPDLKFSDLVGSNIQFPHYVRTIFLSIGIILLILGILCIIKGFYVNLFAIPASYVGLILFITYFFY